MSTAIHAIVAIYDMATFNPDVHIQKDQPIGYRCTSCAFKGNLAQGVVHAVNYQFTVRRKPVVAK